MRFSLLPLLALTLTAQTPSFEVASIRPAKYILSNGLCDSKRSLSPESVLASGVYRLDRLIEDAYRNEVDGFNIPQSVHNSEAFAVSVRIPPNTSFDTCRQMLQNLLAERFHLITGMEARQVNRYYLTVAKSGLKLKPVGGPPTDPDASVTSGVKNDLVSYWIFRGAPASRIYSAVTSAAILDARSRNLQFAGVVDETGLTGYYDGEFEFTRLPPSQLDQSPLPESLEDAVRRQLGLVLELRKTPGKFLVIRSSDRMPTEN